MNKLKKFGLTMLIATVGMLATSIFVSKGNDGVAYAAKKNNTTQKVANIKLNTTSKQLNYGATFQLKISGTKQKVAWTTSNKNVAAVNKSGKVTAVDGGNAVIKATVGKKSYKCNIKVLNPSISSDSMVLDIGEAKKLTISNNALNVKWIALGTNSATVDSKGVVTAKSEGNDVIFATMGKKTYMCRVAVKDSKNDKTKVVSKGNIVVSTLELENYSQEAKDFYGFSKGYQVWKVANNSPLFGKVKYGDIITKVNGKAFVKDEDSLSNALKDVKKGDKVKFTYLTYNGVKFIEKSTTVTIKSYLYYVDNLSDSLKIEDLLGIEMFEADEPYFANGLYVYKVKDDSILKALNIDVKKGDVLSNIQFLDYKINSYEELYNMFNNNFEEKQAEIMGKFLTAPDTTITFTRSRLVDGEYVATQMKYDVKDALSKIGK